MAGSPVYKVYNPKGEYIASCKYLEDAACVVGFNGVNSKVKYDRRVLLWHEGYENILASVSVDGAVAVMSKRQTEYYDKVRLKYSVNVRAVR